MLLCFSYVKAEKYSCSFSLSFVEVSELSVIILPPPLLPQQLKKKKKLFLSQNTSPFRWQYMNIQPSTTPWVFWKKKLSGIQECGQNCQLSNISSSLVNTKGYIKGITLLWEVKRPRWMMCTIVTFRLKSLSLTYPHYLVKAEYHFTHCIEMKQLPALLS